MPSEPGMGEERERSVADAAPVSPLIPDDLSRAALRAEHALPEERPPKKLPNLRLRWDLIELVHASHGSEAVPTDLDYPIIEP